MKKIQKKTKSFTNVLIRKFNVFDLILIEDTPNGGCNLISGEKFIKPYQ